MRFHLFVLFHILRRNNDGDRELQGFDTFGTVFEVSRYEEIAPTVHSLVVKEYDRRNGTAELPPADLDSPHPNYLWHVPVSHSVVLLPN